MPNTATAAFGALAVTHTPEQVVAILAYVIDGKLAGMSGREQSRWRKPAPAKAAARRSFARRYAPAAAALSEPFNEGYPDRREFRQFSGPCQCRLFVSLFHR
jgi:hypothetical protein